jgi:hypothetical protein
MKNDYASRVTSHASLLSPHMRFRLAWFCFLTHVLALGAMLLVIQPGLLVGTEVSRREFIAAHAMAWQIGWVIWMPASLGLVLLFLAWADTLERVKTRHGASLLGVALCFAGVIVDWLNETMLAVLVPSLAAQATTDAFAASLFSWWERYYLATSLGLANGLYSAGGLVLSVLSFRTPGFPRWLAWFSTVAWVAALGISFFGVLGDRGGIFVASAIAFALFMPWILVLGYVWFKRKNPVGSTDAYGRLNEKIRSICSIR